MVMLRAFLFIAVLAFTAACGDDIVPTTPTPDRPQVSEDFAGILTVNGAATHSFQTGSGLIRVRLNALSPDSTVTIGVSLGTWNGTACQIVIANDSATQSVEVVGNASTTGGFCARVYDVGRLSAPTEYSLTVVHF